MFQRIDERHLVALRNDNGLGLSNLVDAARDHDVPTENISDYRLVYALRRRCFWGRGVQLLLELQGEL